MRSFTAILALCAALSLSGSVLAQPPGYEVRTYIGPGLTSYYPGAAAPFTENTFKEPWVCPYCGYSTGGTWDVTGGGAPSWDANNNGVPDEAEGNCPDPWNTPGHPANVALIPASMTSRLMMYRWLGPVASPVLTLVRGIPFKPGEIDPSVVGGATNAYSRVRVGFAFDPGNSGLPSFAVAPVPTQVRFLLIPPGVARPTARYHSLSWAPETTSSPPSAVGSGEWGQALDPANIRIGVHPWRAVDGDMYHVRVRLQDPADTSLDVEVWSETNGLEYTSSALDPATAHNLICASGAVRISTAANTFVWNDDADLTDVDPPQWWAFRFRICNNCRIMPNAGDDGTAPTDPGWITDPTGPAGGLPANPSNYFTAQPNGPSRGQVLDTYPVGLGTLSDATATEFRLRPGETGTGMVAVIWRNDAGNMWSYDEDSAPSPDASTAEPAHPNGVQPVAARFFCSRVDTENVTVDLPAGAPGGATQPGVVGASGDLAVINRQIGEIVRCPLHVPNLAGRGSGDPVNPYIDPLWVGNGTNGSVVGRAPGGDTPFDPGGAPILQAGLATSPTRTIGCGAVHVIDPGSVCWCGRTHNPAVAASMYCNYCGTKLLDTGTEVDDAERAAAQVGLDAPTATASHQAAYDPLRADAVYSLARESVRGTKDGVSAPGATFTGTGVASTLNAVASPLFASLPAFQLPSYAPGGNAFTNGAPQPYQGGFVAYRTVDEDRRWYEDPATGAHDRYPTTAAALPKQPVDDSNGRWDVFYRCPDCGNIEPAPALVVGTSTPYQYTDRWTTAGWTTELACTYGRGVGATAPDTGNEECPGHQICPACGVAWEVQGEGQSVAELETMTLTVCPFDGTTLVTPGTLQTRMMPDYASAEEYDPLIVQANVMRKTRLAADRQTVDLGRVERSWNVGGFPVEVTPISQVGAQNEGNFTVTGAALLTQGLTCASPSGSNSLTVTTSAPETLVMVRADADMTAEKCSATRSARSLPITRARLYAATPTSFPAAGNWGGVFAPPVAGSAGGQAVHALMRGGTLLELPIPIGEGSGNYSGAAMAFVDTDGDGGLNFLDRSVGLTATNSLARPFDPTEDYPLEPVIALNLRLRVAEARMPGNDLYASDASPVPLFVDTNGDGLHDRLDVVWESNRPGIPPTPNAAVNLFEATSEPARMLMAGGTWGPPGIARDYRWDDDGSGNPWVDPITMAGVPGTVNGSPDLYLGGATRWLLWHKLTPTDAGVASTLWSASAPGDMSTTFAGAGTANYIFDSSLDKSWIRGFVNPTSAPPNNHWSFWNSGKRGKEEIHYCANYSPTDPNTVSDTVLPVSNGAPASAKRDWVLSGGVAIRKPPKSPFTYVRHPSPVMEMDPATGAWVLHTFFSGYVPQENNSDICYERFTMADLADASANYGKLPFPAITGTYGGEELRADGPRQTFGSRHLDWATTRRRPDTPTDADFMRAVAPADPQVYIHLVFPSATGSVYEVYQVTWAQEVAATDPLPHRYNRAEGVYRLGGLTFTQLVGSTFAATINPVEPRTGRPLEMAVDPAAGLVRFSAPLYNPTNPADPATFFNSTNFPGLADVQIWANYTPFVYRLCRNDANDDSPSAFFDYGDPGLISPAGTPAERASLGRFVIFWRRSHGASEPPHFGRTSFMYKTYSTAIEVAHPPIMPATVTLTDTGAVPGLTFAPIGVDAAAGILGLPTTVGGLNLAGRRVQVIYDSASGVVGRVEYHTVPGWSEEKRVNIDTVYSEGPLTVRKEWYAVPLTDSGGTTSTQYLSRYWLFWTSPRGRYTYDSTTGVGEFAQSLDVYYATVVPEPGTSLTEVTLPSS
jgi:hypothetical protein